MRILGPMINIVVVVHAFRPDSDLVNLWSWDDSKLDNTMTVFWLGIVTVLLPVVAALLRYFEYKVLGRVSA
jgi:hypothetical protein